jgi:hypothetical protein
LLCNKPCENPAFPYHSETSNLCYNSKILAAAGKGSCDTWCTNDVNVGSGCGENWL